MSLRAPESVQKLQTALHAKAKEEPSYRFYALYDKLYRADVLAHAWRVAKANGGAAGVDGQNFRDIEEYGVERWLGELAEDLRKQTYRPQPVRRVYIPKPDRSMLPAGIDDLFSVYEIRLASEEPHRQFLRQRGDLEEFRTVYEAFLAELVRRHAELRELHLFAAVPAPVVIICGHTVLPKKHPTLLVYDKVAEGGYVLRLKVK